MSGLRFGLSLSMQGRGGKAWRDYHLFETGSGFLYDFSRADTLFQEATGITPAAVDQNVGLALEQSKWAGKTLAELIAAQPELVTNGGFDSDTGWSKGTGWSISAGKAVGVNVPAAAPLQPSVSLAAVVGRAYRVAYEVSGLISGGVSPVFGGVSGVARTANGTFSEIIIATTTSPFTIQRRLADFTGSIDNISVKEIPGNHASQATSGARPVLKAGGLTRYDGSDDNLLTTLVPSAAMTLAVKFVNSTAARVAIGASTTAPRNYLGISNLGGTIGGGVGDQNWDVIRSPSGDDRNNLIIGVLTASAADGVRIYRNAVQVYAGALSGTPAGSLPFRIGASNSGSGAAAFLFGDIYKALAINRALTPAEVLKLTNAWSH